MDKRIMEIRKIVDDWFSLKKSLPPQDIMPHLVYLLEQYELLLVQQKNQNNK